MILDDTNCLVYVIEDNRNYGYLVSLPLLATMFVVLIDKFKNKLFLFFLSTAFGNKGSEHDR